MKVIDKYTNKLLIQGLALMLFSMLGLIIFYKAERYLIHPSLYIVTSIMGTGWSATSLYSIKTKRKKGTS